MHALHWVRTTDDTSATANSNDSCLFRRASAGFKLARSCTIESAIQLECPDWCLIAVQMTKEEGMLNITLSAETLHNQVWSRTRSFVSGKIAMLEAIVYAPR